MKTKRVFLSCTFRSAISAGLAGALVTCARGQTNIFDDFESGFAANGWITAASPSTAMTISTGANKVPATGTQSAKMVISTDAEAVTLPTAVSSVPWKYTFWLDDNDASATRALGTVRHYTGGTYNNGTLVQLLAAGKYNSVNIGTWNSSKYQGRIVNPSGYGFFNLDDPGSPNRSTAWHKFDIVCGQNSSSAYVLLFYVDNILSREFTNTSATYFGFNPDSLVIGSISAGSTAGTAYFDGIQVVQGIPFISSPPASASVTQGNQATLSVGAIGNGPFTYQWRKNGQIIANATDSSYTLSSPAISDSGTYSVFVTNSLDWATAGGAVLTVTPPLYVTVAPTNMILNPGGNVTFTATASGQGTITYQWKKNGGTINGQTDSSLTLNSVGSGDAATYTVTVHNGIDPDSTSNQGVLGVNSAPTLASIPNQNGSVGTTLAVTCSASGPYSTQLAPFQDFESANSGSVVEFCKPSFSGSTGGYVDANGLSYVTNVFPAAHPGAKALKVNWSFTSASPPAWLRLTTAGSGVNSGGNPTVAFNGVLQFDMYTDKSLNVALGLRENNAPGPIGSDSGASGASIEWVGVTGTGSPPSATTTVPAGAWTTLSFNLATAQIASYNAGNGVLDSTTGFGTLEHLALVAGDGQAGAYNIYLDNFYSVPTNASPIIFSLDTAPSGAAINPYSGTITWTPSTSGTANFTVRATDNYGLYDTKSFTVTVGSGASAVTSFTVAHGAGSSLSLNYSGGAGNQFVLIQTNNPFAPPGLWTRIATNFVTPGSFNISAGNYPAQFYRVKSE